MDTSASTTTACPTRRSKYVRINHPREDSPHGKAPKAPPPSPDQGPRTPARGGRREGPRGEAARAPQPEAYLLYVEGCGARANEAYGPLSASADYFQAHSFMFHVLCRTFPFGL
jgi:hypothetical protein